MVMKDSQDLLISCDSSLLRDKLNHFINNMVSSRQETPQIIEVANTHPNNPLSQLYAASLFLFGQTQKDILRANVYLAQASKCIKNTNPRETILFEAIQAWRSQDFSLAIKVFTHLLIQFPKDLVSLKYLEFLFYLSGQQFNAPDFLWICEHISSHYENAPHFYSSYSFALELNGEYDKAIEIAEHAIALEIMTPWAHHTLAHAYLFKHKFDKAIQILEALQPTWESVLATIKTHNNWHLGLFYIANGDVKKANQLYQQSIWGNTPDIVFEQVDAISYLWQMEMTGLSHTQDWKDIVTHIAPHAAEPYTPFNSLFYLYASLRSNNTRLAKRILHNATKHAKTLNGSARYAWEMIGLPTLGATQAFVQEEYAHCLHLLEPVLKNTPACGGSDAQIKILKEMYCVALLKNNQKDKARQYFNESLPFYKGAYIEDTWF